MSDDAKVRAPTAHIFGIPVVVSDVVPRQGYHEKMDAPRIRVANVDTLAHGGRLIDCENPRWYSPGWFLIDDATRERLFITPAALAALTERET